MSLLIELSVPLVIMAVLVLASAFFSCSEVALFYLRPQDRRDFRAGNSAQRIAAGLLEDPDRLLTAVLFWNLMVNMTFFLVTSIVGVRLQHQGRATEAGIVSVASLLTLLIFGETLPKSLGVLKTRPLAQLLSIPLAAAVRAFDPLAPLFRWVKRISFRILLPTLEPEPYLELEDLERAIQLSTSDAALLEQEQTVLKNIVQLADIRVEELMRPRTQFATFRAPVSLEDVRDKPLAGGYVLVSEPDSDEVAEAVPLRHLSDIPGEHLEFYAAPVVNLPWCASASRALELLLKGDRKVVVVVNEFGETIGVLTFEDLLATVILDSPSRTERLHKTVAIEQVDEGVWMVAGLTSLRRLSRYFDREFPSTHAVTVAGALQEVLQRMPAAGDRCVWGDFDWEVASISTRGRMKVRLTRHLEPEVTE